MIQASVLELFRTVLVCVLLVRMYSSKLSFLKKSLNILVSVQSSYIFKNENGINVPVNKRDRSENIRI